MLPPVGKGLPGSVGQRWGWLNWGHWAAPGFPTQPGEGRQDVALVLQPGFAPKAWGAVRGAGGGLPRRKLLGTAAGCRVQDGGCRGAPGTLRGARREAGSRAWQG